jgi:hypothetical protein
MFYTVTYASGGNIALDAKGKETGNNRSNGISSHWPTKVFVTYQLSDQNQIHYINYNNLKSISQNIQEKTFHRFRTAVAIAHLESLFTVVLPGGELCKQIYERCTLRSKFSPGFLYTEIL